MSSWLWWLSCLPELAAFQRSCGSVAATQRKVLREILRSGACSRFGREHELRTELDPEQFRARVPVRDYAGLESWIGAAADGEPNVLSREPVRLFEPTSGSQQLKLIPYTAGLQKQYARGVAAWVGNLFGQIPALARGPAYWSVTPPPRRSQRTTGGFPIGFDDDAAYLGGWAASWVRRGLAVQLDREDDYLESTVRQLVRCRSLRLISVWSPTFLLLLLDRLGGRRPAELWPELRLVSCWGDGASASHLTAVRQAFPHAQVQPKGLLATEGLVSFPLYGRSGGVLALRSHFFEFLDEAGHAYLAHELLAGQCYQVVLTTAGGLYRYRLGDQVRVLGHQRECPRLEFVGRRGVVSDRCGEKLDALAAAAVLGKGEGLRFLAWDKACRGYVVFSEGEPEAEECEKRLLDYYHYRVCRELGQLPAVRGYQLEPGFWEPFYRRAQALGSQPGALKPSPLRREDDWSEHLPGRFT